VPDAHRRKFLALTGRRPTPPQAAWAVAETALAPGAQPVTLPAGVELEAGGPDGAPLRFSTAAELTVSPVELAAVQTSVGGKPELVSDFPFAAFGAPPQAGSALYLGLRVQEGAVLPAPIRLWVELDGEKASWEERQRVREEQQTGRELCEKINRNPCCGTAVEPTDPGHCDETQNVQLVWEYAVSAAGALQWRELDAADQTRALTFSGAATFNLPEDAASTRLGGVDSELRWVRIRLERGCYDASPRVVRIAVNAVAARQATAIAEGWTISAETTPQGTAPAEGDSVGVLLSFSARLEIEELTFTENQPHFRVLGYQPPTAQASGRLALEAVRLGVADGGPFQRYETREKPLLEDSFDVWSLEDGSWRSWQRVDDFDRAGRRDRSYSLDAQSGEVRFGDGEKGVAPPPGALLFARARSTAAAAGNVKDDSITRISSSALNRVLLGDAAAVADKLSRIRNPRPATNGEDVETLEHALGLAVEDREAPHRAVTLADYESLARATPGANVARATAKARLAPGFDCWPAPGFVTVIVIPNLPGKRPRPSGELLSTVKAYLNPRRLIGTRVEVIGPDFVEIAVHVRVKAHAGKSKHALAREIAARLDRFLNPLTGGPEGGGWPLGRSVYPAETLQVIDETPGVDYASGLELARNGCPAGCGALHLPPNGLPAAGAHQIEVV